MSEAANTPGRVSKMLISSGKYRQSTHNVVEALVRNTQKGSCSLEIANFIYEVSLTKNVINFNEKRKSAFRD